MTYDKFTYLTPAKAEIAITASQLSRYEGKGWVVQTKKNGANSTIYVSPKKEIFARGYDKEPHQRWSFSKQSQEAFLSLPDKWFVFNAELLHDKTPHIKDVNYIHDVLVANGEYLIGKSYEDRYNVLLDVFGDHLKKEHHDHYIINNSTWLAKNFERGFRSIFDQIDPAINKEDEGIVLKKLCGALRTSDNNYWLRKCRKPKKAFDF